MVNEGGPLYVTIFNAYIQEVINEIREYTRVGITVDG